MNSRVLALAAIVGFCALTQVACDTRSDEGVVNVSDDNQEMKDARAEALGRFPEFLSAFERRKTGDAFAVKIGFPIRNSTEHEFMWIDVRSIRGDVLGGRLDSEPIHDVGVKSGDEVSAQRADIHDWMYSLNGAKPVGGFQVEVLRKLQKEGGQ